MYFSSSCGAEYQFCNVFSKLMVWAGDTYLWRVPLKKKKPQTCWVSEVQMMCFRPSQEEQPARPRRTKSLRDVLPTFSARFRKWALQTFCPRFTVPQLSKHLYKLWLAETSMRRGRKKGKRRGRGDRNRAGTGELATNRLPKLKGLWMKKP